MKQVVIHIVHLPILLRFVGNSSPEYSPTELEPLTLMIRIPSGPLTSNGFATLQQAEFLCPASHFRYPPAPLPINEQNTALDEAYRLSIGANIHAFSVRHFSRTSHLIVSSILLIKLCLTCLLQHFYTK